MRNLATSDEICSYVTHPYKHAKSNIIRFEILFSVRGNTCSSSTSTSFYNVRELHAVVQTIGTYSHQLHCLLQHYKRSQDYVFFFVLRHVSSSMLIGSILFKLPLTAVPSCYKYKTLAHYFTLTDSKPGN